MQTTDRPSTEAYLRPNWLMQRVVNPVLMRVGAFPTLAVQGRKSGEWKTVPVNVLEMDGVSYLFAARGTTEWVRNLRVSGEGEIRQRGKRRRFSATELSKTEKPPIIEAYLKKWGWQIKSQLAALPPDVDHPVFRIEFV